MRDQLAPSVGQNRPGLLPTVPLLLRLLFLSNHKMASGTKRHKPHRVAVWLSTDDHTLLVAIVASEKDTVTNTIRRMIRSRHHRIFSPRPQALTLRLPQQQVSEFTTFNEKDQNK